MVDKEENQALSEDLDGDQLITKTLMAEKETIDIIIEHENEKEQILDPDYEMDENEINSSDDETEINEATNLAQEVEEEPEQQKNLEEQTETNKKRNRNALKEKWDKNVIKKLRMQGTEYKGYERTRDGVVKKGIARPARRMSMKCLSEACKKMKNRHCYKFSEEERTSIFTSFWQNTNWDEKRVYATSNIEYISKKRSSTGENSRRSGTFNYFLRKADNTKFQVCKKMFLGTMGLKEDMVQDWVKKTNQNHGINAPLTARKESQNRNNQKRNELIKFFDSLPKMPSHYCRKESSKLYLEQFFQTKQELYKLYKKYCEDNSFPELVLSTPVFDQVFSDMNLALYQPRKDRCDTCCGYETKNISEEEYQEHLRKKERARQEKNKDKELAKQGKVYTLCMDMQAVKICPMINASAIYYKTKLSVHNFTIYDMDSHVCKNYWFNETEGDLSASTFANFVIDFIKDKCTKKIPIILYSDGCSYQNKNVVLSNALLNYSIKNKIVIEQKYLQKGHTQMECDAVHSLIERKLKGRVIELPSDYIKATQEARNKPLPLEAVYITHDFFLDYGDQNTWVYNSIRPGKKANDPTVSNLKHLKYNFYSQKIEYKIDFDHELQLLPARSLKYPDIVQYKALHNSRLKIKQTKWKHLQEIKSVLSKDCHDFYDNLPF